MNRQINETTDANAVTRSLRTLPMPDPPLWLHGQVMVEIAALIERRRTARVLGWYGTIVGSALLLVIALTHVLDYPGARKERAGG